MQSQSAFGRCSAILVLLPCAAAALCPSRVEVKVTDSSLYVGFRTDTPGAQTQSRLQYGRTPRMRRTGIVERTKHATAAKRYLNAADLEPGLERLYFDPQVSDEIVQRWSSYRSCQAQLCPGPGPQPGGYACEADGAGALIPYVETLPDNGKLDLPRLPRHARTNPRARPQITGKITKLTDCKAVQQVLNDHGAGGSRDPSLNHEIRLPAGRICRPELEDSTAGKDLAHYSLPEKYGPGVTIITCDRNRNAGPPPGVQYSPRFRNSASCGFGLNWQTVRQGSSFEANGALFLTPYECGQSPCTEGWRFETLVFETGDWRNFSPRKVAVESVDTATGRITLAEPIDSLYAGNAEAILNLPGIQTMESTRGGRRYSDLQQRGCLVLTPARNQLYCYGYNRMIGEYAGGGYVTASQGYEIAGCASADGATTCTLTDEHGLGNFPELPIAGMAGGVLELQVQAHGWNDAATILVEGNSACDGVYSVASLLGDNSAKLARTGCSGEGGTARRLYMGRFFDLEGAGAGKLEGAHLIDFPGPRTVRAFNVDLAGAAIDAGGFVYSNPKTNSLVRLASASRITWDRILFDIRAPFRAFDVIQATNVNGGDLACDCAVLDSYVRGLHFWQPIAPAGVVERAQTYSVFSSIPVFMRANIIRDIQLDGITFSNSNGFAFFADSFGPVGPQDITMRRLKVTVPDELVAGPRSRALAFNARHFIELKAGVRIHLEGIEIQNWPSVGVAPAAPIYFSYAAAEREGAARYSRDLTIRNIFMRSVAAGMAVSDNYTDGYSDQEPIRRVLIDNWLLDGVDYPNRQSAPHGQALELPGTFHGSPLAGGFALWLGGPMEDVKVSRVTARRLRSKLYPNFLTFSGDRSNGLQIDRSIISFSPTGHVNEGVGPYATNRLFPPITEGGAAGFQRWATRMGEPDPRSWFGSPDAPIGVIPCLSDSSLLWADFNRRNNTKSAAERAFACSGPRCDRWNVILAGRDRQSCAEREALVLDRDLNGIGPFEGLGADTKELARALGYVPAQITDVTTSGAKLIYAPLSSEPCIVDHGRDPDFKHYIRGRDTGGEGNRGMQLDGYDPGETGYYRLLCPRAVQVWGRFETEAP